MKYSLDTALLIIVLFFVSQAFGLFVMEKMLTYEYEPYEPKGVSSAVDLLVYILFFSILFIILYKLNIRSILIYWYYISVFLALFVTFSLFLNELISFFMALAIVVLKSKTDDDYFYNMVEIMMYGGVASIFLPLFNLYSSIVLLVLISIYDFIAVIVSKHMITLAKAQFNMRIFSGIKIKVGKEYAILGGGDVIFPMILAGVLLRDLSPLASILSIYGSMVGLIALILIGRRDKFYPAMPFLSGGAFLGLFIFYLSTL